MIDKGVVQVLDEFAPLEDTEVERVHDPCSQRIGGALFPGVLHARAVREDVLALGGSLAEGGFAGVDIADEHAALEQPLSRAGEVADERGAIVNLADGEIAHEEDVGACLCERRGGEHVGAEDADRLGGRNEGLAANLSAGSASKLGDLGLGTLQRRGVDVGGDGAGVLDRADPGAGESGRPAKVLRKDARRRAVNPAQQLDRQLRVLHAGFVEGKGGGHGALGKTHGALGMRGREKRRRDEVKRRRH
ncbi:MAG: hypothetical protein IT434_15095 [Phycisphaerales bacterium]|nr:hypothetical protein [Phycisphaerales bacterium]